MRDDPAVDAWIAKAKAMPVEAGLLGRHVDWRNTHSIGERKGHCPAGCTKNGDGFAIHGPRGKWICRPGGAGGRDAISLARHITGMGFLEAVEALTGEPMPKGSAMTEARRAEIARENEEREAASRARREEQEKASAWYRERERRECYRIWSEGVAIDGTPTQAYLRHRCISAVQGAILRHHSGLPYFHPDTKVMLHRGPAMLAPIIGPDQRFAGLHMTYLDPRFVTGGMPVSATGKLQIPDAETGEILTTKKVRGSQKRGHLDLGCSMSRAGAKRLVIGEGIETVGSVRDEETKIDRLPSTLYWSSIDLGNLGGRATDTVRHPTLKRVDKRGRASVMRVPGPEPDLSQPGIPVPEGVTEILILGDGDSDHFSTRQTLLRAGARFSAEAIGAKPRVLIAWAEGGKDFNDMKRAQEEAA